MHELIAAEAGAICRLAPRHKLRHRLCCKLFGHGVDNRAFAGMSSGVKSCRCGAIILQENAETRIRHTVSCFLFGHRYAKAGERDSHGEYVCLRCGHPLLFETGRDPYAGKREFRKRVRYLCNLFGHRVRRIATRAEATEYACRCGHSFIKREPQLAVVKHPLVCLFAGHYVRFIAQRSGYAEYACRNCGHPFCFTVNE